MVEENDKSLSPVKIAGALARAGMTANGIYDAIAERDGKLFKKYSGRKDAETRYAEIAADAVALSDFEDRLPIAARGQRGTTSAGSDHSPSTKSSTDHHRNGWCVMF
ncbi:MAG: hypothetical protein R2843_08585 [Thermomicrobiales bacterium]